MVVVAHLPLLCLPLPPGLIIPLPANIQVEDLPPGLTVTIPEDGIGKEDEEALAALEAAAGEGDVQPGPPEV
eukprot:4903933-Karenia_brevis.AAC.1